MKVYPKVSLWIPCADLEMLTGSLDQLTDFLSDKRTVERIMEAVLRNGAGQTIIELVFDMNPITSETLASALAGLAPRTTTRRTYRPPGAPDDEG